MDKLLFVSLLVLSSWGCNNSPKDKGQNEHSQKNNVKSECMKSQSCDSVYSHKNGLLFCLKSLEKENLNYVFQVFRPSENGCESIFSDSIFSKTGELKFEDFNSDGTLDVLIQNNSDVRSNWTYSLYFIENNGTSVKEVKEFSRIKNPKPVPNSNLVESYVVSGKNYYEYFQVADDFAICQFDTTIYESIKSEEQTDWKERHNSIIEEVKTIKCKPF